MSDDRIEVLSMCRDLKCCPEIHIHRDHVKLYRERGEPEHITVSREAFSDLITSAKLGDYDVYICG